MLLTRDSILQAQDIQTEDLEVPEWGGTVRVCGLTGTQRDQFESSIVSLKGKQQDINMQNVRAKLVALSVVDEEGQRIFQDDDIRVLGMKSAVALQRVFDVAQRLSGITEDDVEELAKN